MNLSREVAFSKLSSIVDRASSEVLLLEEIWINNGNWTEWIPIRSVIIRVINKIGRPRGGSPIC